MIALMLMLCVCVCCTNSPVGEENTQQKREQRDKHARRSDPQPASRRRNSRNSGRLESALAGFRQRRLRRLRAFLACAGRRLRAARRRAGQQNLHCVGRVVALHLLRLPARNALRSRPAGTLRDDLLLALPAGPRVAHRAAAVSAARQRLPTHFPAREKARVAPSADLPALERSGRLAAEAGAFHRLVAGVAGPRVAEHARAGVGTARTSRTELFARFAGRFAGVAAKRAGLESSAPAFLRVSRNSAAFRRAGRSTPRYSSPNTERAAFRGLLRTEPPPIRRREGTARPRGTQRSTSGRRGVFFRRAECRAGISRGDRGAPGCEGGCNGRVWCRAACRAGRASGDSPCRGPSWKWRRTRR